MENEQITPVTPVSPDPGPKPANYLVWSIITTVLFFWPLGIPAIVNAAKVNRLWDQGRHDEARAASGRARGFAKASCIVGIILITLITIFYIWLFSELESARSSSYYYY